MKKLWIFVFMIAIWVSCDFDAQKSKSIVVTEQHGFDILTNNCIACHSADPNKSTGIAPSLTEIARAYHSQTKGRKEFVERITSFVLNPSKTAPLVPEAKSKYGVMPELNYSEEEINALAGYLFDKNVKDEGWFKNQYPKDKEGLNNEKKEMSPLEKGKALAMKTKSVLGKNLMSAIKKKGVKDAIDFCNVRALTLTDSMAVEQGVKIKRVSDLNRNPKNKADSSELTIINEWKERLEVNEELIPQLHEGDGINVGYYPIITNDMCMKCHGDPRTEIEPEVLQRLSTLYPRDKAIGYEVKELRGMWVVEMPKSK